MKGITSQDVDRYVRAFHADPRHKLAESILRKTSIHDLAGDADARVPRAMRYTVDPANLPLTDQEKSGRCWLFSFTNMIRRLCIKKYKMDPSFRLSTKYLMFWDKLERCNTWIEIVFFLTHKRNVPIHSLEMSTLRNAYPSDGGTWHFFANLVAKYGLVPYEDFPENRQSSNTGDLGKFLENYLRSMGTRIAALPDREAFDALKPEVLETCFHTLVSFLGMPPVKIHWNYQDAKGKLRGSGREMTPVEWYRHVVRPMVDVEKCVVLINDPRRRYDRLYSVELMHNVLPDRDQHIPLDRLPTNVYLNVSTDVMRKEVFRAIRRNHAVPFAADVSYYMNPAESKMETDTDYKQILGYDLKHPKKLLFENMVSSPNHAMLMIGTDGEHGGWWVENSWGQQNKDYPYLTMTDDWFEHYVGEVIIPWESLSPRVKELSKRLEKSGKMEFYPFWDVFGTLARK